MSHTWFVSGIPKPQPRGRAYAVRIGEQWTARAYMPSTAEAWKSDIVRTLGAPTARIDGPVRVDIVFLLPRPKHLMRKKDPNGPVWCPVTTDRDNLDKAVLDTLYQQGWLRNDAQVVAGEILKLYHAKEGRPGAVIRLGHVSELPGVPLWAMVQLTADVEAPAAKEGDPLA